MYMWEVEVLLVIKHQNGQTQELDRVKSMCLQIIKKMEFHIRMGIYLDVRACIEDLGPRFIDAGGSVSRLVSKQEVKATHAANGWSYMAASKFINISVTAIAIFHFTICAFLYCYHADANSFL